MRKRVRRKGSSDDGGPLLSVGTMVCGEAIVGYFGLGVGGRGGGVCKRRSDFEGVLGSERWMRYEPKDMRVPMTKGVERRKMGYQMTKKQKTKGRSRAAGKRKSKVIIITEKKKKSIGRGAREETRDRKEPEKKSGQK